MNRTALVVGINNYENLNKLIPPANDAEAIAKMLEQYGEFDKINRLPIDITDDDKLFVGKKEDKKVKFSELEKALCDLFLPSSENSVPDLALFFFAGHGLRNEYAEDSFLATSESSPKSGNRGFPFSSLRKILRKSPVKTQVVFLDCCYSGELADFEKADPPDRGKARDRLFIAACRESEPAYEEISRQHGVFTRTLLNALDPTTHPSGIVDNFTIINRIRDSWKKEPRLQVPMFHNPIGQFFLTRLPSNPVQVITTISETVCPYRGLKYFDFKDESHKFFFGRTALTDQLLDKVRESNFMAVLGASGSGKSSVIRAGLIHHLRLGQRLSGSDSWKILMFRPGEEPLDNLALAFLDPNRSDIERGEDLKIARKLICNGDLECLISPMATDNRRVVLLVDQFEEVFTLCRHEDKEREKEYRIKRQLFVECLLQALPKCGMKICLILAMRADFFGKCAEQEYSGLSDHIRNSLVVVKPMNPEELRDAIVKPAKLAGAEVEPELIAEIVGDVEDSPGTLPLMQYALTELWKVREDNFLKLTQYSRMGGVKGTLAKRADEIYGRFSEPEKDIARRIFIELTQLGEGTEDTRRQVRKDALISLPEKEEMVNEVIRKLADEKLIVTGEAQEGDAQQGAVVDVAHEALIRNWTQLRTWLDNSRDDIRFHRRLSAAAEYWEKHGKAEGLLWRAPDLDLLEKFHGKYADSMKPLEREFYKASIRVEQRRKMLRNAVISIIVVLMIALGIFGYRANNSEKIAVSEREKAQSLLAKNYWSLAVTAKENNDWLKSAHFWARAGMKDKAGLLLKNCILNIQSHILSILISEMKHQCSINGAVFSKDDRLILTWSDDGVARLWNAKDGSAIALPMKHKCCIHGAVFSKDEQLILTWSDDGTAQLWNTKDGSIAVQPMKHEGKVNGAVFSKDDRLILTWSDDTVRLWKTKDTSVVTQPMKHQQYVRGAIFSNDERWILSWSHDGTARLWSAKDGSIVAQPMRHKDFVDGAIFSKDDRFILTWSGDFIGGDGMAQMWNAKDGSPAAPSMEHEHAVNGAVFSKDEQLILTWSGDYLAGSGMARLWNTKDGSVATQPMKHEREVKGAVFSKDERLILTWSADGTIREWNTKDGSSAAQPMKHEEYINGAMFSKDDRLILSWGRDATARLWNAKDGSVVAQSMKHEKEVNGAAFFGDERRILTWSFDGTARLWNAESDFVSTQLIKHTGIQDAVFLKDERQVLIRSWDSGVGIWNTENGSLVGQIMKHSSDIKGMMLSKDEHRVLTWSFDGTVRLWNAEDGSIVGRSIKHDHINGALLSKDGCKILTWSGNFDENWSVQLWNGENGSLIGQPMRHNKRVNGVVFSHDEKMILTWSDDATVQLWNANNGSPIVQPMKHKSDVNGAIFSKNDQLILTWSKDGTAMLWNAKDGSVATAPMKHKANVNGAIFSKDDQFILTWSVDGTARLWDAQNGNPVAHPMEHHRSVIGAIFSKDDRFILTWSDDGVAKLWNRKDGLIAAQSMRHEKSVDGAIFSMDDRLILTWTGDSFRGGSSTVQLWNTEDGSPVAQSMKYERGVYGAFFSKDLTRIFTWGSDGMKVWNIDADYDFPKEHLPLLAEVCTGTAMDDYGNVRALNKEEWETRKQEYIRISEDHLKTCKHKTANIYLNRQKPFWGK